MTWIFALLTNIFIAFFLLAFAPEIAGYVSAGISILIHVSTKLFENAKVHRYLRPLFPAFNWVDYEDLELAARYDAGGEFDKAIEAYARLAHKNTFFGRYSKGRIFYLKEDWDGLWRWVENVVPEKTLKIDHWVCLAYIRALGESHEHDKMLKVFAKREKTLRRNPNSYAHSRLYILSFCGCPEEAEVLSRKYDISISPDNNKFWVATAHLYAGDQDKAFPIFETLVTSENPLIVISVQSRMSSNIPANVHRALTTSSLSILEDIKENPILHSKRYRINETIEKNAEQS